MTMIVDSIQDGKIRLRAPSPRNIAEDLRLAKAGVLDRTSLLTGYRYVRNPVIIEHRGPDGNLKSLRRSHNIRTNLGGDLLAIMMGGGGDTGHATVQGYGQHTTFTSTAIGATSATSNITPGDTLKWLGHILSTGTTYGIITAHGSGANAVFTVDQWYDMTSAAGAAGANPATGTCQILPGQGPCMWMALSNEGTAATTTDSTIATEIAANGLSRAFCGGLSGADGFTHVACAATSSTSVNTSTTFVLKKTFTCATAPQAFVKEGILNAKSGGILLLENSTFTLVSMAIGDTAAVSHTVTLA